ncbi:MAG: tetratricopeptide repeat protein [Anaerolineae bacterium]|nr:tetratricopeptide repeat protein [Anaerolineae bacterium]
MIEYLGSKQMPATYIPLDRRRALALHESLPDRCHGTALFADISGFTPLTEALTEALGPKRGAEELTRQLNRVYDALIAQVHRYGGSVIGFAGDAITCWFDADGETDLPGDKEAALQAVACAQAMQRAMRTFAAVLLPSGNTASLAMKVALASGPARRFLIGDPDIQRMDALAGATVTRMATAEHLAQRGDIIADAQTAALLGTWLQIREWRSGPQNNRGEPESFAVIAKLHPDAQVSTHPISMIPLSEEQVRPWMPPAIYEWLRAGLGESPLELKPVVALFLNFQGLDYDQDADAGQKLDVYIRWVQETVGRYEGTLLQLIIGDKGNYLYATFGAPHAHEDDTYRAVSTALELLNLPENLAFIAGVQIGISQGTMRAGAYGSHTRHTYGVIGDEVNMAARLMQNAPPGTVLVSNHVQETVMSHFTWQRLDPIKVKGKEKPVQVARPLNKTQRRGGVSRYAGAIVGRETEIAGILQHFTPLFDGTFAGVIYVDGEAGVGKSRLIYELRQRLMTKYAALSWFTCPTDPILHQSLNPFKYMARQYFGQSPEQDDDTNRANFQILLDALITDLKTREMASASKAESQEMETQPLSHELERTRSILGALVDLYWPDSLYQQLEPELRFRNTLAAFKTLVQAESLRQPVVLHIEDAHWLDPDSQEMIKTLTRNVKDYPFALLVSGRYRDDGDAFRVQIDETVPQHALSLNTLTVEGVSALAAQVLNGLVSPALGTFLTQRTEGNPLFVEQLTLDLRERQWLILEKHRDDSIAWTIGEKDIDTVPDTVNAVLIARLDRLTAQVKSVVQTASVLGREFEVLILSSMLREDHELTHKVQRAEDEMIWSALGEMHYIFRHTMMRDAAYEMQLQTRLQTLHAMAATTMEQVYANDLGPHYADLAYHYGKAGNQEREFYYARLAGEHATARYANQEAIEHYLQALRCVTIEDTAETRKQRQAVHAALGELLITVGHYEAAQEHLDQALSLALSRQDQDGQTRIYRWLARMAELRGDYPVALRWIDKGRSVLVGRENEETAEMQVIAGLILTRRGDYNEALAKFQDAMRIAQKLEALTVLARAQNGVGLVHMRDKTSVAIQHFQQAFDLYERVGYIPGKATTHNLIAMAYFDIGQWREADPHWRQALDIFTQIGDVYNSIMVENNLGEIALAQGKLDEAQTFYRQALYSIEEFGGSPYVRGTLAMNLGHVSVRQGDTNAACKHLNDAHRYFNQVQARDFLPELYRHFAEAAIQDRKFSEASDQIQQALAIARELDIRGEQGNCLRVMGEIAMHQEQIDTAVQHLQQSLTSLQEAGDEYNTARTQLVLAHLYAQTGNIHAARQCLAQCAPIFERLGAASDLLQAHKLQETVR